MSGLGLDWTISEQRAFGRLLREWRTARGMSQLALSMQTGVSARHLSYMETGRSSPSRDMVLTLAQALEMPLRERNTFLQAAGFAAMYRETPLGARRNPHPAALDRPEPLLCGQQALCRPRRQRCGALASDDVHGGPRLVPPAAQHRAAARVGEGHARSRGELVRRRAQGSRPPE